LEWKEDIDKRTNFLYAFAKELKKKENLAKTAIFETRKAIKESRSEVEKCAWIMEYFADNGKLFQNGELVHTDARKSIIACVRFLYTHKRAVNRSRLQVCKHIQFRHENKILERREKNTSSTPHLTLFTKNPKYPSG
jgi:hypothetical protein